MSDLRMSPGKMSDFFFFFSFPYCVFTFVIKMRDLDFKLSEIL